MPHRIQLSRARGWMKPPDAVVVARPGKWGNPFKIGIHGDAATCVRLYREWLEANLAPDHPGAGSTRAALDDLRGRDLACWCRPGAPCHADVLLELANK